VRRSKDGNDFVRWRNTRVKLTPKKAAATKSTLLDVGRYPVKEIPAKWEGRLVTVELPADAMYLILQ
jgi:hypothetical protein